MSTESNTARDFAPLGGAWRGRRHAALSGAASMVMEALEPRVLYASDPAGPHLDWIRPAGESGGTLLIVAADATGGWCELAVDEGKDPRDAGQNPGVLVARDADGAVEWTFRFPDADPHAILDAAVHADGSVVIVGEISGTDGYVAKISADGRLVWHTLVGGPDVQGLTHVSVAPDGDIHVGGWGDTQNQTSPRGNFVAVLDATGRLQWTTYLQPNYDPSDPAQLADWNAHVGPLVDIATSPDGSTYAISRYGSLYALHADGTFRGTYVQDWGPYVPEMRGLTTTPDGGIVYAFVASDSTLMAGMDGDLEYHWCFNFLRSAASGTMGGPTSLTVLADGTVAVVGYGWGFETRNGFGSSPDGTGFEAVQDGVDYAPFLMTLNMKKDVFWGTNLPTITGLHNLRIHLGLDGQLYLSDGRHVMNVRLTGDAEGIAVADGGGEVAVVNGERADRVGNSELFSDEELDPSLLELLTTEGEQDLIAAPATA